MLDCFRDFDLSRPVCHRCVYFAVLMSILTAGVALGLGR
jgi:hypothetical protein